MYIQCIYVGINDYQRLTTSSMETNHTDPSWYCWYSETKSFMLDSASVNSISSIPSPVYQWRKALRRNIAVKYLSLKCGLAGCRNLEAEGFLKFQYVWAGETSGGVYEHHHNFPTKATPKDKTFDSTKLDCHKKTMDPNKERCWNMDERLCNSFEHFLDGSGISSKRHGHFQTLGRNVAHGGLQNSLCWAQCQSFMPGYPCGQLKIQCSDG